MASDTGFNISRFAAKVNARGHLKPSNALVRIYPDVNFGLSKFTELEAIRPDLEFYCEATNVPGVRLMTTEFRRYGYGVIEKKPYVPVFTDINLMFRADANSTLYSFFQSWIKMIINFDGRYSINTVNGALEGQSLYEVAYKHQYMATMEIVIFNPQGKESVKIVLVEAYPLFLGEIPLNWSAHNEYIKIPVQFTFKDWYIENENNVDPANRKKVEPRKENFNQPLPIHGN